MTSENRTPTRLSIRLRLTLWNTSVLALLLTIFAFSAFIPLRPVLQARSDGTVRETARAISGAVIADDRANRVSSVAVVVARCSCVCPTDSAAGVDRVMPVIIVVSGGSVPAAVL